MYQERDTAVPAFDESDLDIAPSQFVSQVAINTDIRHMMRCNWTTIWMHILKPNKAKDVYDALDNTNHPDFIFFEVRICKIS